MVASPDNFDHLTFASLLAGAIALMKVMEKFIEWASRKLGGDRSTQVVSLAEEPTRLLRETHGSVQGVAKVIEKTDSDGLPLAYTPRSVVTNQLAMAEALRDVSKTNERLSESYQEISQKVSDILGQIKKS